MRNKLNFKLGNKEYLLVDLAPLYTSKVDDTKVAQLFLLRDVLEEQADSIVKGSQQCLKTSAIESLHFLLESVGYNEKDFRNPTLFEVING